MPLRPQLPPKTDPSPPKLGKSRMLVPHPHLQPTPYRVLGAAVAERAGSPRFWLNLVQGQAVVAVTEHRALAPRGQP